MQLSMIPTTNILLQLPLLQGCNREFALGIVRTATDRIRQVLRTQSEYSIQISKRQMLCFDKDWDMADWERYLEDIVEEHKTLRYKEVINATGIIIHTNLGRAPLAREVREYVYRCSGYVDVEIDIVENERGGRLSGIVDKITTLTGAEDVLVVNNNAAAVLLVLAAMMDNAQRKEVIISRGEMVEIGGSFRIPDVITQSGAILKEIGCTNKTHLSDYANAIGSSTGAILRVHPSNYKIQGFTHRPHRAELVDLAKKYQIPLIEDVGSGLLQSVPDVPWKESLRIDELIQFAIQEGVDIITASGDKLLGGPQAGLIIGKKEWVQKCAKHPLYRALRVDKMVLSALEATLQMHVEHRCNELPVWEFLQRSVDACYDMAVELARGIPQASVEQDVGFSGGGALPHQSIATWVVKLSVDNPDAIAKQFRLHDPPILVRVHNQSVQIDTRTLYKEDLSLVRNALEQIILHR